MFGLKVMFIESQTTQKLYNALFYTYDLINTSLKKNFQ